MDKEVDLEIYGIEVYNDYYIDMIRSFRGKNANFYRAGFYDKQKKEMYDVVPQEGHKAGYKRIRKSDNL